MTNPLEEFNEVIMVEKLLGNLNKKSMFTRHNLFTFGFWACIIVIGVLQALQGQGVGDFTALIGILGGLEHALAGDTGK